MLSTGNKAKDGGKVQNKRETHMLPRFSHKQRKTNYKSLTFINFRVHPSSHK